MFDTLLARLLDPSGLTPHGFCLLWEPWLIWAHAGSNIAIGLAYFSIPIALIVFLRRRRDLAFKPIFVLFAAFILLCGAGHFADLLTLWVPAYGLEASIKLATASVSVATAVLLWPLMPQLLALPSPGQLQQANAALAASAAHYRERFLRSPVPLHILGPDGRIAGVSNRWLDLLGYQREEVIGRPITDFLRIEPGAGEDPLLGGAELHDVERRFVRRDGTVLDVLVSQTPEAADGAERRMLGALVDVTARRRAEAALRTSEEQRRHTQKMDALGQLAGGIAHDFNNVLQAVGGGATLIERRARNPDAVAQLARMVGDAAARGAATTRRLLAFAGRGALQAVSNDPATVLEELRAMLAHTLGGAIAVRVATLPDLPPLLADRAELDTVLINLATNARDAMPNGGTLTLGAALDEVPSGAAHATALRPGRYLRLSVADTGMGMDAETLARATEPFFTTKPPDRGTGLGLATARGFAEQSGGALTLASSPGAGTTVSLWLPAATGASEPATGDSAAAPPSERERCRVLLVDDEPLVRAVLAAELEDRGYAVVAAAGYQAALARLGSGGGPFDLLITDFSMPDGDGLRLIGRAQTLRPGLRAILLTGQPEEAAMLAVRGALSDAFTLLRKPVGGAELAERAQALLSARSGATADRTN